MKDGIRNSEREVLSVKELADYLGLSESIIRRLVKENRIPFIKIEARILFFLPVIRKWLVNMSAEAISCGDTIQQRAHTTANIIWNNAHGV